MAGFHRQSIKAGGPEPSLQSIVRGAGLYEKTYLQIKMPLTLGFHWRNIGRLSVGEKSMNKTLLIGEVLNKEADPCQQVSVNASIERSRDPLPHDSNRFSRSFASRAIRNDSHEQKASSRWH